MNTSQTSVHCLARSGQAFEHARRVIPGGVNSPVRAFKAVGRDPIVIRQGRGPQVTDLDGNTYIDYVGSYGPLILGHCPDTVLAAVNLAASEGMSFGAPTERETQLAQMIIDAIDSIEMVRFVNSGTEATMSVLRLARAATDRPLIVKFTGCYHGHSDGLLVQAGSGATTLGIPSSPGVPQSITDLTLLVPFNDLEAVKKIFAAHPSQIAAVIVEPVAGNMGCILPRAGFLEGLRQLCDASGALLVFDEVMTGFRVAWRGAQSLYQVKPDLTCLGKVIGGGLPCAAYGGSATLMKLLAPEGPVYQAGTLSGNPLAMAAGIATLQALNQPGVYQGLNEAAVALVDGLQTQAQRAGVPVQCSQIGSMVCCFFTDQPVQNYQQALRCDTNSFAAFFGHMLEQGVLLPPSQFETWFVSTTHDPACIQKTVDAAGRAFEKLT